MILVVDPARVAEITDVLTRHGETVFTIGSIVKKEEGAEPKVHIANEAAIKM